MPCQQLKSLLGSSLSTNIKLMLAVAEAFVRFFMRSNVKWISTSVNEGYNDWGNNASLLRYPSNFPIVHVDITSLNKHYAPLSKVFTEGKKRVLDNRVKTFLDISHLRHWFLSSLITVYLHL